MESAMKSALNTSVLKAVSGSQSGGCVSEGNAYETDHGKVFIKTNIKEKSDVMFRGEQASLLALVETRCIRVPSPLAVVEDTRFGAALALEYLHLESLDRHKAKTLGIQLARLHLHNSELESNLRKSETYVGVGDCSAGSDEGGLIFQPKFGFSVPTCCGFIEQDNVWCEDWPTFFARKLEFQLKLVEKKYGDREVSSLFGSLLASIPHFFKGLLAVRPALLHGDLWSGNAAQADGEPVIFDAASFYGHSEYDLAISRLFGGFPASFWAAYDDVIPPADAWRDRYCLYKLFHELNHWNHFGSTYRSSSVNGMKEIIRLANTK